MRWISRANSRSLCPCATGLSVEAYLWRVNVSVCLSRARKGGVGGERDGGESGVSGVSSGVIGMSGSKI